MTKEGVASLRAARAARAAVVSTVRAGGGGGVRESVLRGYGISKTKTGAYKYYDPVSKGYVTTKPATQIAAEKAAEVKVAEVKVEPKAEYFYQPKTGKMSYRVAGEQPRGEGWVSMGAEKPTAYAVRQARGISEIPHRIVKVREPTPRVEPPPGVEPVPRPEVPSMAEIMREQAPPPTRPLAPPRVPEAGVSVLPSYAGLPVYGIRPVSVDVTKGILEGAFVIPRKVTPKETKPVEYKLPYKRIDITKIKPVDISKIRAVDITPDVTKVAEFEGKRIKTWEEMRGAEKALRESNILLFKQMTVDQTKSMQQLSDIRIAEAVRGEITGFEVKETAKPLMIAGATVVGVGALGQVIPAVAVAKVPIVSQMAKFTISPVGVKVVTGLWGATVGYRGIKQAEYIRKGDWERGMLGIAGLGAEMAGVYTAGKWLAVTKGKPITKLYKATVGKAYTKIREPYFERQIATWQKEITAKDWGYLEKRAFIPIKKMPQRTLYGEPILKKEIRISRKAAGLDKGFFGMDVARYKVEGYDTKFFQKHLKDIYTIKGIDLRYTPTKKITITPKKMDTSGYRQILGVDSKMFVFKRPPIKAPLYEKLKLIKAKEIPPWLTVQQRVTSTYVLGKDWKVIKIIPKPKIVTKIDRPFYISKPKLPKPVILGKPKRITPVHLKPEPRPVKIKAAELLPTFGVRPVLVAEPKPPVEDILGMISGGRVLAGALVLTGIKAGAEAFQRQFGVARQRAEQRQSEKLAQRLEQATRQITKAKPTVKVIPKVTPIVKVIPKLVQIPLVRQVVKQVTPTKPYFPYPYYPKVPEPKPPIIPPLIPKIPKFKWPRGIFYPKARKLKKPKPFHKYMPSLVAGFEKITTKEMKIPKYLTGVGIRPVKF